MLRNVKLLTVKINVEYICNSLTLLFQFYCSNHRKANKYNISCFVHLTLKCCPKLSKILHKLGLYLFMRIVFRLKLTQLKIDYVELSSYVVHQQRTFTQLYTGSRDFDKNDLTSIFIFSNIIKYFIKKKKKKNLFNLQYSKKITMNFSFFSKIKQMLPCESIYFDVIKIQP